MTAIEHQQIKGITLKNLIVTVVSTISIVASVMTTYFNLRADISEVKAASIMEARLNEVRLKTLETQVFLLQQDVNELKKNQK